MTETGGQPPVSFPVKDVAVLLFLLRRLTRRGINAACGQCPKIPGYPGRAGTLTGLHPMQVCRCRRPPHPVTFRRSSSTRCGFGAAPAFVCGRPVTGAARPDGGRM
ncbi:hypothetical protein [Shigella sonnei]